MLVDVKILFLVNRNQMLEIRNKLHLNTSTPLGSVNPFPKKILNGFRSSTCLLPF